MPKRTVSHSQTVTSQPMVLGSLIDSTVVTTAPISTTSMTGVASSARGSSLRSAPGRASVIWAGVSTLGTGAGATLGCVHERDSTTGPRKSTGT